MARYIDADRLIAQGWHLERSGISNTLITTMSLADVPAVIIAPCKNCCEREYNCHSKCEQYLLFKEAKKKDNERRTKNAITEKGFTEHRLKNRGREYKGKVFKSPKR